MQIFWELFEIDWCFYFIISQFLLKIAYIITYGSYRRTLRLISSFYFKHIVSPLHCCWHNKIKMHFSNAQKHISYRKMGRGRPVRRTLWSRPAISGLGLFTDQRLPCTLMVNIKFILAAMSSNYPRTKTAKDHSFPDHPSGGFPNHRQYPTVQF